MKHLSWITLGAQFPMLFGHFALIQLHSVTNLHVVTSVIYRNQRCFSDHPHHTLFLDIFTALINNRLGCRSVFMSMMLYSSVYDAADIPASVVMDYCRLVLFVFSDWLEKSSSDSVLRVLNCLRLLIRDPLHQVRSKISV